MKILKSLIPLLLCRRADVTYLVLENLALRQQLAVLQRSVKRPRLRPRDRAFWVVLSRVWSNCRSALTIVKPDTVVRWHRKAFWLSLPALEVTEAWKTTNLT